MTKKIVLIAEDEFSVAEILAAVLGDAGYRVETAINGRQALERLKEIRPNVILVDYMMPVMDGAALLQAVRADEMLSDIPVVIMSSLPESAIAEECRGYDAFLRKPFKLAIVTDMVAQIVQRDDDPAT